MPDPSPSVPATVLVVGCGYVGGSLAGLLAAEGVEVWGVKRGPAGLPAGVHALVADVTRPASLVGLPEHMDAVVYAVSPGEPTAAAYRAAYVDGLGNVLAAVGQDAGRVVLASSTGVFGQDDGRWVDEETDPEPRGETAGLILEGERAVVQGSASGVVLRLGGIYGPGRTRLVREALSGEAPCLPPDLYGNRIHRDDAAAALRHLLALPGAASVYLGVDQEPAPLREVYAWIAERGGMADPCRGRAPEEREGGARRSTNKRCSNRRLLASGFTFRYPTFREGYAPLVDQVNA